MTTSTCSAKTATPRSQAHRSTATEFRFDDDGSLVDLVDLDGITDRDRSTEHEPEIDLRFTDSDEQIEHPQPVEHVEHLVQLTSGEVATVLGANAYQPEGPMTTFFSTGSSRGTIDSWSVRVASYRTNDIVSIQRSVTAPAERHQHRPNLIAA